MTRLAAAREASAHRSNRSAPTKPWVTDAKWSTSLPSNEWGIFLSRTLMISLRSATVGARISSSRSRRPGLLSVESKASGLKLRQTSLIYKKRNNNLLSTLAGTDWSLRWQQLWHWSESSPSLRGEWLLHGVLGRCERKNRNLSLGIKHQFHPGKWYTDR